jgi:hypothetical protein
VTLGDVDALPWTWESPDTTLASGWLQLGSFLTLPAGLLEAKATYLVTVTLTTAITSANAQVRSKASCSSRAIASSTVKRSHVHLAWQITIQVNSPPSGGLVSASPLQGVTLRTNFTIAAVDWIDDEANLPLTYAFAAGVGCFAFPSVLTARSTADTIKVRRPAQQVVGVASEADTLLRRAS